MDIIPSTALVEKKAKFLVSRGFSLVKSAFLVCGSDSPVSEELSTCNSKYQTVNKIQSRNITVVSFIIQMKKCFHLFKIDINKFVYRFP